MTRKLSWKSGVFLTVVLSAVHTIQGSFFDYSDNTVYENEPNDDELLAAPYEDSDSDQTNQVYSQKNSFSSIIFIGRVLRSREKKRAGWRGKGKEHPHFGTP